MHAYLIYINKLIQNKDASNHFVSHWSYVFLALTHRYGHLNMSDKALPEPMMPQFIDICMLSCIHEMLAYVSKITIQYYEELPTSL